jgi:23S rRNA (cytidine1920-2'-O)/16S rRNA (cytidine1409-2'-O)-methyltransferase
VVRDVHLRAESVRAVGAAARELGWQIAGVCASPLPGPAGNVEFFLWLRQHPATALDDDDISAAVLATEVSA